jgi:anthranilate phosphoribosyltransferase
MKQILDQLFDNKILTRDEAFRLMSAVADFTFNDSQLSSLMTVYRMRPITADELRGFRDAILQRQVPVKLDSDSAIDIVGTGGDGKNTFNISTATCFVVAGAGYRVI